MADIYEAAEGIDEMIDGGNADERARAYRAIAREARNLHSRGGAGVVAWVLTPSCFARYTHARSWAIVMGRQPTCSNLRETCCRLIAGLDVPRERPTPHPGDHERYRLRTVRP